MTSSYTRLPVDARGAKNRSRSAESRNVGLGALDTRDDRRTGNRLDVVCVALARLARGLTPSQAPSIVAGAKAKRRNRKESTMHDENDRPADLPDSPENTSADAGSQAAQGSTQSPPPPSSIARGAGAGAPPLPPPLVPSSTFARGAGADAPPPLLPSLPFAQGADAGASPSDSGAETAVPPPHQAHLGAELHPEARRWAMLCHLSALGGMLAGGILVWIPVFGLVMPFALNIIGPLLLWQAKRQEFDYVDDQGKEALNFQITTSIVALVLFVVGFATMILCIGWIFWLLMLPVGLASLVLTIIAAIQANDGERYRYPVSLRLVN